MHQLELSKAFTLMESGPVVLVTTKLVAPPLTKECLANMACKVIGQTGRGNDTGAGRISRRNPGPFVSGLHIQRLA